MTTSEPTPDLRHSAMTPDKDLLARSAYECTVCGALWPHPSFRCSGIGGFADHPQAETRLVKVVDDDDVRGAVEALRDIARGAPGTDHAFTLDDDAIVPMNIARGALARLGGQSDAR